MGNISHILINIIKKIDLFFNAVSRVCAVISSILLVGVTLIIFAGVINRTFFEYTWLFVEEYSALALIPISYLTMGYTLRWNQHLKMDIVVRNVPKSFKRIFGIFAAVFSLICIIYMAMAAIDWFTYTLERHVTSSGALRTPLWFISSTIVAGIVLFAIDMSLLVVHRTIAMVNGSGSLKFIDDDESDQAAEEGV